MGGSDNVDKFLSHYGIPGMKWGKRKATSGEASDDSRAASEAAGKIKRSGVKSLSNKELQSYITRMKLERQYVSVKPKTNTQKTAKFVGSILAKVGKKQVITLASSLAAKQIAKMLKNAV